MRYFIADCHFGCENLVMNFPRRRPGTEELFASIEEHDDYLIQAINLVVGPDDELHVLGDFSLNKPGKYRMQIKCKHVYLTRGNHDKPEKSRRVFGEIPYVRLTKLRYEGETLKTVLCHTPMAFWEGSHKGWAHLYGHCHGRREETLNKWMGWRRRSMDVSVDSLYKRNGDFFPMSEAELYCQLTVATGHDDPEFYPNHRGTRNVD